MDLVSKLQDHQKHCRSVRNLLQKHGCGNDILRDKQFIDRKNKEVIRAIMTWLLYYSQEGQTYEL